ncbi:hypothetical protein BD770DRAFT_445347 [Pilaira anomala]|nr:hypothetical protein BD770DRAFT_445347 [Pilaira anomala]
MSNIPVTRNSGIQHTIHESIPLTTEEPIRRRWLKSELEDLNKESDSTGSNEEEEEDTSDSSDTDSLVVPNKISNNPELPYDTDAEELKEVKQAIEEFKETEEEEVEKTDKELEEALEEVENTDMMQILSREMEENQARQSDYTEAYEHQHEVDDDHLIDDPELQMITESNRHIPYDEHPIQRTNSIHGQSELVHKQLLVFSENPSVIEEPNRRTTVQYYGAGKSGIMPEMYRSKRKPKKYLVACDFSKESLYAMEWTMGAIMRDGDELHIATVSNRDDNPDVVKATGLDQAGELYAITNAINTEAKQVLGQMMLFNIKLVSHAMIGRIKDALKSLTRETDYTMLVCGSKGRTSVKKLLLGSVSTYLVHKSPVPVAVIRRQKKKKRTKHEALTVHSLSEGLKTGHLHVDELS